MGDDKTEPQGVDPTDSPPEDTTDNPISRVDSRVVPSGALRVREQREPRLVNARRTFAALVAASTEPPLRLKAEFDLVGIGRLRTALLANFALLDQQEPADGSFTLTFEYRGREPLVQVCASDTVYKALRRKLFDHGLAVKSAASATTNKLVVEATVPAAVRIGADRARDVASITLRNVVMLGTTTYELPLESLDRGMIDALVDLITNQGRQFYALTVAASQRRRRD